MRKLNDFSAYVIVVHLHFQLCNLIFLVTFIDLITVADRAAYWSVDQHVYKFVATRGTLYPASQTAAKTETSLNIFSLENKMASNDLKRLENVPRVERDSFSFIMPSRIIIFGVCGFGQCPERVNDLFFFTYGKFLVACYATL